MKRLTDIPTLHIDTGETLKLSYLRRSITGVRGDTVATALYAAGVRIFSRSLKYHRPRGLYSLDGECSNTMMEVNGEPNVRTERRLLKDGMKVRPQNIVGLPEFDLLGFLDRLSVLMPAGWYYRYLHKPESLWPFAAEKIRKAAGIGKLPLEYRTDEIYDEIYPNTDVCVIGGGAAGMAAAVAAANTGLRVILLESRPWLGGCFDYREAAHGGTIRLYEKAGELKHQISQLSNIRVFTGTAMIGTYSNNLITAFQRGTQNDPFDGRYIEIRSGSTVVASGCTERPLIFENNDIPGVMQTSCAHRLAKTWGILPGKAVVFSIGHDLGIEAALDLHDLGMDIACVADIREDGVDRKLIEQLKIRNIPYRQGWVASSAHGKKGLKSVTLKNITGVLQARFSCDILACSAGLTPVSGPLVLAGAKLSYDHTTGYFLPENLPENLHAAGRMLGFEDAAAIECSGRLAGLKAAEDCGIETEQELKAAQQQLHAMPGPVRGTKLVTGPSKTSKAFICFDEDVSIKHINQSIEDGYNVPELIKRYSAAGTGPGQGGISAHNLPLYVAMTGLCPDPQPVPTTVRPPLWPVSMAAYAGSHTDVSRCTPLDEIQTQDGGKMERIGAWRRARRFSGDPFAREEIINVRQNVGILDASTLGKFRIFGPDALKALERVYVGDMTRLTDGKIKYSAMCNQDGCLIDDGVVVRRNENDYYFTTSTARAGQTIEWIRYHTRYDNWNFHIVNLTDALAVINLAGPNARNVLERITDEDVSNTAFPFGGYREFKIKKTIPVRVMRLGFVGELSYELHVPSSYALDLWHLIKDAGSALNIANFGLEAQNTLRLEKGHIIIGSESEQRTTLHDLNMGFLISKHKKAFQTVGMTALEQTEHQPDRLKLAGFRMHDKERVPKDGSIVVDTRIRGYVCTARYSHTLDASIGLALVEDGRNDPGSRLDIFEDNCNGQLLKAKIVKLPFYDPEGKRLRM